MDETTVDQSCPSPIDDPQGYALWCELHACRQCCGEGEGEYDDGLPWHCGHCDGTGVEPEEERDDER